VLDSAATKYVFVIGGMVLNQISGVAMASLKQTDYTCTSTVPAMDRPLENAESNDPISSDCKM